MYQSMAFVIVQSTRQNRKFSFKKQKITFRITTNLNIRQKKIKIKSVTLHIIQKVCQVLNRNQKKKKNCNH